MWILPNNLKQQFPFAQESVDSKEDSNARALNFVPCVTWRGKLSLSKTWSVRWRRVYWIQRLSGRTLDPSMEESFMDWWTGLLEDTHAREKASRVKGNLKITKGTFGQLFEMQSQQLDLGDAFLKTSTTISPGLSHTFLQTYATWVTQLRQESLARRKRAHHMREIDFLSSLYWPTATVNGNNNRQGLSPKAGNGLATAVKKEENWLTPTTDQSLTSPEDMRKAAEERGYDNRTSVKNLASQLMWTTPVATDSDRNTKYKQGGTALSLQIKNYPTPTSRDYRNQHGEGSEAFVKRQENPRGVNLVEFLQREQEAWPTPTFAGNNQGSLQEWGGSKNRFRAGHPDQDNPSTDGNSLELSRGRLNPKWVCQLMGTTFEKIFFVRLEIP